jgi:hypothetical protein
MVEATPMPEEVEELKIEVVPVTQVPPAKPDHAVNGLEAWFVNDGKIAVGSLGMLRSIEQAFEVRGMPKGQKAWIIEAADRCQLVREAHDGDWEWLGEFPAVRDALQALSKKLG